MSETTGSAWPTDPMPLTATASDDLYLTIGVWNCALGLYEQTMNLTEFANPLKSVDIALLNELERNTNASAKHTGVKKDQPYIIAASAGFEYILIGKRFDWDPGGERCDAILSRYPLYIPRVTELRGGGWGGPGPRVLTEATIVIPGRGPVRLAGTRWTNDEYAETTDENGNTTYVLTYEGAPDRERECAHTLELLNEYQHIPTILGGDLNEYRDKPGAKRVLTSFTDAMTSTGWNDVDYLLYRNAPNRTLTVVSASLPNTRVDDDDASDHQLLVARFLVNPTDHGDWELLDGTLTSAPGVCSWGPGHLDVFVRGKEDKLWHRWWLDAWSDWEPLGHEQPITSAPAAASWGQGRIDVVGRGANNTLRHIWYVHGEGWYPWESHGESVMTSGPAICSWTRSILVPGVDLASIQPALRRLDIFARGSEGKLNHMWYTGSTGWHDWETLHNEQIVGAPGATSWEMGRIDVVARRADNACWHTWYADGQWYPWESLGGVLTSDPAICSGRPGRFDIFARGTDNRLWHKWYVDGEDWYEWEQLGPHLIGDGVDATAWARGRLDIFARGVNNDLIHKWNDGFWRPS